MTDLDPAALLRSYDAQLRPYLPDPIPDGVTVERDGPLVRIRGLGRTGFVTYRELGGLAGAEVDELIARQRDFFAGLGEPVEWTLCGHDEPADLGDRLRAAGFQPEERETVVVGPVASLSATLPVLPEGVRLREVTARADLDRIVELESTVWNEDRGHLTETLAKEIAADPMALTVVVAEAIGTSAASGRSGAEPAVKRPGSSDTGQVVSAGWVRYVPGTRFATLWGGSTLREWRGRGIYRALVAYRARLADVRGFSLLQVDASDDSRPILERLGFVPITTTTPYLYTP